MPAYNENRWFAIFFVIFIVVNLYLFMNIILAVIYNNYRKHLKNEVKNLLTMKKNSLRKAYDSLTEHSNSPSEEGLNLPLFRQLMDQYFAVSNNIFKSRRDEVLLVDVFWSLLAIDGKIMKKEFLQLAELFNMHINVICADGNQRTLMHSLFPSVYESNFSQKFRLAVKSKYFRYTFDCLILMNAVFITFLVEDRLKYLEWCLLAAFTFEIIAKLYTFGFLLFVKKFWNLFDSFVIGFAIVLWFLIEMRTFPERNLQQYLDLILILRILRLCKLIKSIERFNVIVKTVQALLPSIMTYGGLLFVVFYIYAIVGMQLFSDLVSENTSGCQKSTIHCCPEDNAHSSLQYCTINFNSFGNAMLFLFDLMVVNQWHVLAKGPELLLSSKWTRLYFISFHLLCVIIVLNIFTAFVLEAFILEYTNSEGSSQSTTLQAKLMQMGINCASKAKTIDFVDADHDNVNNNDEENIRERRFSIPRLHNSQNFKIVISEKKSVEALLTRMFENELIIE
ncbi:two pore calcium channel protein 1-like protein, partial [Leptotrombidium deliense]